MLNLFFLVFLAFLVFFFEGVLTPLFCLFSIYFRGKTTELKLLDFTQTWQHSQPRIMFNFVNLHKSRLEPQKPHFSLSLFPSFFCKCKLNVSIHLIHRHYLYFLCVLLIHGDIDILTTMLSDFFFLFHPFFFENHTYSFHHQTYNRCHQKNSKGVRRIMKKEKEWWKRRKNGKRRRKMAKKEKEWQRRRKRKKKDMKGSYKDGKKEGTDSRIEIEGKERFFASFHWCILFLFFRESLLSTNVYLFTTREKEKWGEGKEEGRKTHPSVIVWMRSINSFLHFYFSIPHFFPFIIFLLSFFFSAPYNRACSQFHTHLFDFLFYAFLFSSSTSFFDFSFFFFRYGGTESFPSLSFCVILLLLRVLCSFTSLLFRLHSTPLSQLTYIIRRAAAAAVEMEEMKKNSTHNKKS